MQPSDQPPTTLAEAPPKRRRFGWLDRTNMYGFELFMALFGLFTTAVVLDYGLFALFNYLKGLGDAGSFVSEASLWIAVAMFVWLPVTLFFYLRVRGEDDRNPAVAASRLHKFFTAVFLFFTIITAIGAAFTALYSLVRTLLGIEADQTVDTLVRVTLPAVLMMLVHLGLAAVVMRPSLLSRRSFSLIFGGLSLLVVTVLLVVSVGTIRAQAIDQRTEDDLRDIETALSQQYRQDFQLPSSLEGLTGLEDDTEQRLSEYEYRPESQGRYQLCATFVRESSSFEAVDQTDYQNYVDFSQHPSGRYCFKLSAGFNDFSPSRFNP